tara:strand:- start:9008 stop:9481 length:474 start_codon:yes stop_codon:yes gene_type:complete
MKKNKKTIRIIDLWLGPLLVGSLVATGYNLTQKLDSLKNIEIKAFLKSFSIKKKFHEESMPSFQQEPNKKKKPRLVNGPSLKKSSKGISSARKTPTQNSYDNPQSTKESTKQTQTNHKKNELPGETSNNFFDSLPSETQLFFKTHTIDEVIKKLPMP